MTVKHVVRLFWVAAIMGGSMGGCRCGQGGGAADGPTIKTPPIGEEDPNAPKPVVDFPKHLHSRDPTLNAFVDYALEVCARGDYDGFRQLFGTAYTPTSRSDFEQRWYAVRDLSVVSLYRGPQDPPEYYLHVVVRWREPDHKGRAKRDAVVMVYREANEWQLGPAPKEIASKVLAASTRPARSRPAGARRPASPRASGARPGRGTAPGKDAP